MKDDGKTEERKGEYLKEYGVWMDEDGTARVPMKGFPLELFLQWNAHCVTRHSNCRWEKVMSDHEKARAYEAFVEQRLKEAGLPEREQEDHEEKPVKQKPRFMGE